MLSRSGNGSKSSLDKQLIRNYVPMPAARDRTDKKPIDCQAKPNERPFSVPKIFRVGSSAHMCRDCVRDDDVDRGSTCLDGGAYLLNWKGCAACGSKDLSEQARVKKSDHEDHESVVYEHRCQSCSHLVATHKFTFNATDTTHETKMRCELCGNGEDEREWNP